MGNSAGRGVRGVLLAAALTGITVSLAACSKGPSAKPETNYVTASPTSVPTPPLVPPHGGVNLDVLVLSDGTPPVKAIGQQLDHRGHTHYGHQPSRLLPEVDNQGVPRPHPARRRPWRQLRGDRATRPRPFGPVRGRGKRAGLVRAHVRCAPGGRLLATGSLRRDEPARLQRVAEWRRPCDQGGRRMPGSATSTARSRSAGGRPAPRRSATWPSRCPGRRRHVLARRGDPGLVRPRRAGVAIRQPGAPSSSESASASPASRRSSATWRTAS